MCPDVVEEAEGGDDEVGDGGPVAQQDPVDEQINRGDDSGPDAKQGGETQPLVLWISPGEVAFRQRRMSLGDSCSRARRSR